MSEDQDKPVDKPIPLDPFGTVDTFVADLDRDNHPRILRDDIEEARQEVVRDGSIGDRSVVSSGRSDTALDIPLGPTLRQKVNRLLFLGLALVFFGMVLAYSYTSSYAEYEIAKSNALASPKWPSTMGTITSSRVNYEFGWGNGSLAHYVPDVVFRYSVNGKEYSGHQISFPKPRYLGSVDADRVRDAYPIGSEVQVFYDPLNPATSCLVTGITHELEKRLLWRVEGHTSDAIQNR